MRRMLGAQDPRAPGKPPPPPSTPALLAEDAAYTVQTARWPVLSGLHGEGLLLRPKGPARRARGGYPDPGQTPEMIAGLTPAWPPASNSRGGWPKTDAKSWRRS